MILGQSYRSLKQLARCNWLCLYGIFGAPDLIVEVLSAGNQNADLAKKKAVYEEFGVKEYFIIDPSDKTEITYFIENSQFIEQQRQKGKFISRILIAEINF